MGLQETLEELKEQRETALKAEEAVEEPVVEEVVEETTDEPAKEEVKAEPPAEVVEEKPVEKVQTPEENAHFAKLRREAAAAKKEADEAKRKLAEHIAAPETASTETEDVITQEMKRDYQFKKASDEFSSLELEVSAQITDYDDTANAYKAAMYHANRIKNPRLSHEQLLKQTAEEILMKASALIHQGKDPFIEMYEEAKSLGYGKKQQAAAEVVTEEKPKVNKPNMDDLAKNRARNAGMAAAKGAPGTNLTQEAAAAMTSEQWMALDPAEKSRILAGG